MAEDSRSTTEKLSAGHYLLSLPCTALSAFMVYFPVLKSAWISNLLFGPGQAPEWYSWAFILYMIGSGYIFMALNRTIDQFIYRSVRRYTWFQQLEQNKLSGKMALAVRCCLSILFIGLVAALVCSLLREEPSLVWMFAWLLGIWGLTGVLAFGIHKRQLAKTQKRTTPPDYPLPN